jgi:glycosyltransferase involved in cell wall biosynthesis
MRLLFALPGFHREDRGAEIALLAVADELARGGDDVTVVGSGYAREDRAYNFVHVGAINRTRFERFPHIPPFRSETSWEDATFAANLLRNYDPSRYDAAVTCSYPFTQWALRRPMSRSRPLQIFVTQNGDWPAKSNAAEFRLFRCDGLVCTNPDYQSDNEARWPCALIPNGVHLQNYDNVMPDRASFGLPNDVPLVLMVSAMIESKRVAAGIEAVAQLADAHLVVAGDGPLRDEIEALAANRLPGRFTRLTVKAAQMPTLYASADAFLHMSLLESFGNVYVEAMASGLPIVANDTPRLRWIVGERSTLCDGNDVDIVAAKLRLALETGRGKADPRAREFAWSSIAQKYRAFISSLPNQSRMAEVSR